MGFSIITDNLKSFEGTGLLFTLLLAGVCFLGFKLSKGPDKTMMVWFPLYALIIYFCPLWIVYSMIREDSVILYRVLWLIPIAVVICYAMVEFIWMLPSKKRAMGFLAMVLVIILSGRYVYSNSQFFKAENKYHIPESIVKVCDEISEEGVVVSACFPLEMVQYVRQYSAYIRQPYGRDTLLLGADNYDISSIATYLDEDVLDIYAISAELRERSVQYLIVSEDTVFSDDPEAVGYELYKKTDGYDIYTDIGTEYYAKLHN